MPRGPRQAQDSSYYHLIARANNRLFVFHTRRDFLFFKALIRRSKRRYPWKVHHYCLMSNHFHILGYVENGKDLPLIMHFLLLGYSRYHRKRTGYLGHVWQGRYKSMPIEKESYLLQCAAYIERNPLRARMVKAPLDYAWSSCAYYSEGRPDSIVDQSPYWESFGVDEPDRRKRYLDFVNLENPYHFRLDKDLIIS